MKKERDKTIKIEHKLYLHVKNKKLKKKNRIKYRYFIDLGG